MKLLLIGNSFSYYWTDELYQLLAAAGQDDAMVCNIYYSGCTFDMHLNWWKTGETPYTFIIHDRNGRTIIKDTSFEACLSYAQWDKISFQQSGRYIYNKLGNDIHESGFALHDQMIADFLPELYRRVHDRFPNAEYYWLQNWAHELDNGAGNGMSCLERQLAVHEGFRDVGLKYCKQFGFTNVPCGDAWVLIRHDPMFYAPAGEGEIYPKRMLHSRIFKASFSANFDFIQNKDIGHDGDIGGGQYLNACVWFEMLTKTSVVGNSFVPCYVHEDAGLEFKFTPKRVTALQNAAHQAVLAAYGEAFYE